MIFAKKFLQCRFCIKIYLFSFLFISFGIQLLKNKFYIDNPPLPRYLIFKTS